MDKTKIIAIIALIVGIGFLVKFKEAPLPPDDDDDHHDDKPAQSAPPAKDASGKPVDFAGGVKELQIKDIAVGSGAVAKPGDEVTVNYRGTLLNGTLFDESYGRAPFSFRLGAGDVIQGWDKGVAGMKVGGKRQLTIPSDLGYGPQGQPPKIPGGATLKFDVELLAVKGK